MGFEYGEMGFDFDEMSFDFGASVAFSSELSDFPFDFITLDKPDNSDILSTSISFSDFPSDFDASTELFNPYELSDSVSDIISSSLFSFFISMPFSLYPFPSSFL